MSLHAGLFWWLPRGPLDRATPRAFELWLLASATPIEWVDPPSPAAVAPSAKTTRSFGAGFRHAPRPRTAVVVPRSTVAGEHAAEGKAPTSQHGDTAWSPLAPSEGLDTGLYGLPLSARVLGHEDPRPARTTTPKRAPITSAHTQEAVRSIVRDQDRLLGLGNPQETVIAAAVQEAGRASGVPSGTHFTVLVEVDPAGAVTHASLRGDTRGDFAWPGTLERVRTQLSRKAIPLGLDEREKGARVTVQATVLHVLPSGNEQPVVMGECPKMPLVGGEAPPSFFAVGGTQYLEPPLGLCALGDAADVAALKTIVVRTTTKTERDGDAPPLASSFPRPPKKKLLPTPMELLLMLLQDR